MRFTNLAAALASVAALGTASLTTACLGTTGEGRDRDGSNNGSNDGSNDGSASPTGDDCTEVQKDVVIRSAADMAELPKTGCYDLFGKLTIQGSNVTSLAGLNGLNSVNELVLDSTSLTSFDTKGDVGIYGKLTVTNNTKLASLDKLAFGAASTGISITNNPALTTAKLFEIDDPALTQVNGDLTISGNSLLAQLNATRLANVTGVVTISNNPKLASVSLNALAGAGSLLITNNATLATLGTMSSLYRVGGNLMVSGNTALTNLAAFTTSLKFVDAALTISNNTALTDLGSLKHLSLVGAITITGNQNLLACRASEIDRCTQHPVSSVINNNKSSNCSTQCN